MKQNQNILYEWEYDDIKNRSSLWYIIALSIAISLIIWWFISGQYGLSIAVMLVSWIFFFLENNSEDRVRAVILDSGIKAQDAFYEFWKISAFRIAYEWDQAIFLRLNIQRKTSKIVTLRIDNSIAQDIRRILLWYIEESDREDIGILEKITHYLKL